MASVRVQVEFNGRSVDLSEDIADAYGRRGYEVNQALNDLVRKAKAAADVPLREEK